MAAAAWPGSLPTDVLVKGFRETFGDNVMESPNDAGRPKRRRRFTKSPRKPVKGVMAMTRAQVATFETFFETTLSDGVKPFTFTHPRTLASVTVYFTAGSPPVPRPDQDGTHFLVDLNMEFES